MNDPYPLDKTFDMPPQIPGTASSQRETSGVFMPTHVSDFNEPVEIVRPVQGLAGMICVRRADGYEWFTAVLKPLG